MQRREFRVRRGLVQARVAVLDRPIIVGPEAIRKVVGLPFAGRGDVRRRVIHHRTGRAVRARERRIVELRVRERRRTGEIVPQAERMSDLVHDG